MASATEASPYILPAPPETRAESGILWYEIRPSEESLSTEITGFHGETGLAVTTGTIKSPAPGRIVTTLRADGVQVVIDVRIPDKTAGSMEPNVEINGHPIDLAALTEGIGADQVAKAVNLTEKQQLLCAQWARIADAVTTLGEIAVALSPLRSWSCGACGMLGFGAMLTTVGCGESVIAAVATGGAAAGGAFAACGAAVGAHALYQENCGTGCT